MSFLKARSITATVLTATCLWVAPGDAWAEDACNALTQSAIHSVMVKLGESRAEAQIDGRRSPCTPHAPPPSSRLCGRAASLRTIR